MVEFTTEARSPRKRKMRRVSGAAAVVDVMRERRAGKNPQLPIAIVFSIVTGPAVLI
jgi:hypothetical protein